jgi:anti-sigma B factor antagonist
MSISPEPDDGTPTRRLEVAGELDVVSGGELREAVDRVLGESDQPLVVDLSRVTFVDSSGLAALLAAAQAADRQGTPFSVACPPGSEPRLLIELSGTQGLLGLED